MIDEIDSTSGVVVVVVCCDRKDCCYQGPQQCSGGSLRFINISRCLDVDTFIENGHKQFSGPPTETSVMLMNISL